LSPRTTSTLVVIIPPRITPTSAGETPVATWETRKIDDINNYNNKFTFARNYHSFNVARTHLSKLLRAEL
jgi:hypothetical protein